MGNSSTTKVVACPPQVTRNSPQPFHNIVECGTEEVSHVQDRHNPRQDVKKTMGLWGIRDAQGDCVSRDVVDTCFNKICLFPRVWVPYLPPKRLGGAVVESIF